MHDKKYLVPVSLNTKSWLSSSAYNNITPKRYVTYDWNQSPSFSIHFLNIYAGQGYQEPLAGVFPGQAASSSQDTCIYNHTIWALLETPISICLWIAGNQSTRMKPTQDKRNGNSTHIEERWDLSLRSWRFVATALPCKPHAA